jgi:hypothetical protein
VSQKTSDGRYYKQQPVDVVWGNNSCYCDTNRKHVNKLYGQNGECLVLEASGSCSQVLFETCLGLVQK